jgi:hypothetical protein
MRVAQLVAEANARTAACPAPREVVQRRAPRGQVIEGRVSMRILVNGQQSFGAAVLQALLGGGEDVVAVYCAPDEPGGKSDPLSEAAREDGILQRQPDSFETRTRRPISPRSAPT